MHKHEKAIHHYFVNFRFKHIQIKKDIRGEAKQSSNISYVAS